MYSTGNVTVYVSDMDRAVQFYSSVLGLKLLYRFGNHWASLQAGRGLHIGLHPASPEFPAGRPGSIAIGLELSGSIHDAVARLSSRGVHFAGPPLEGKSGTFAHFTDPDGNPLYLAELKLDHIALGEGSYPA
jgi:predicted enzyme related to lactoylglutathione lyase